MSYSPVLIAGLIVPAAVCVVLALIQKQSMADAAKENAKGSKQTTTIRLPRALTPIGLVCFLFFAGVMVAMFVTGGAGSLVSSIVIAGIFDIFCALSAFMIYARQVYAVQLLRNEDYFLYRTSFGRRHRIRYSDCLYYKPTSNDLFLHAMVETRREMREKVFCIDSLSINYPAMREALDAHNVPRRMK